MIMARYIQKTLYTIDWYKNGFCYRTTCGCDREGVKNARATAKLLGETIKVEKECVIKYAY